MAGIFVGIPTVQEYKPFRESLSVFLEGIKTKHDVEVLEIKHHMRDNARNLIVDEFLISNKDYLLFLDDDHSGHTPEMLEALMKSNAMFCSMKCYARYYPFQITTMSKDIKFQDRHNLYVKNINKGYSPCIFAGFGMGLIKRELFSKIEKPYFQCNRIGEREDNYFCDKLIAVGIDPIGCFDYALTHMGIDDSNILHKRQIGIKDFVKTSNQKFVLANIQRAIKNKAVKVNEKSLGKLQVVDIMLNSDILIMDKKDNTKEVVMVNK